MCGIAGVLSKSFDKNENLNIVENMVKTLDHRGPDGMGVIPRNGAILGHSRLSIIDVEGGLQPMVSKCGRYILVFNGEIYNYIELRSDLIQNGIKFRTHSDTEVLLELLILKKEKAIEHLNGMFAFCFYDCKNQNWIMARDHFGIKPIYYINYENKLYFASEIKAFKKIKGFAFQKNPRGLNHYFTFQFCLGEETLFKNIKKVEPGYFIIGKNEKIIKKTKYWMPSYNIDYDHKEDYFIEKIEHLLQDSLRLQVRSDVPLGAYLSGGLDSSIVATYASRVLKNKLSVFNGRFLESLSYDESSYARSVCADIKGNYHDIVPTSKDFVEFIPDIIYSLDEPLAGPGVFPQFMVSKFASDHVKVILGGQGGDEIFGGYARYLVAYLEQSLKASIFGDKSEGADAIKLENIVSNLRLLEKYKPMLSQFWSKGLFNNMPSRYFSLIDRSPDSHIILTKDAMESFSREQCFDDFESIFNSINSSSYINKMSNFDQKTLLPALLHVEDRVSMASSIESRVPLLDPRISELLSTIPPKIKFKNGKTKALLNDVASLHISKEVINRKDKMGFPVPLEEWMRGGEVKDFVLDTLLSRKSIERGIYKKETLEKVSSLSGVGSRQLWGILSLELWHQIYIDA